MNCPVNFYAFAIDRHWFTIAGLVLDIVGVLLLAKDLLKVNSLTQWLLGHEYVQGYLREFDIAEASRMADRVEREFVMPATEMLAEHLRSGGRVLIEIAVALIVTGFGLQIIGAWPC